MVAIAVGCSVLASALTSVLVVMTLMPAESGAPDRGQQAPEEVDPGKASVAILAAPNSMEVDSARNAAAIAKLEERVAEIGRALEPKRVVTPPDPKALLQELAGTEGERHMAIGDLMRRLIEIGADAVPDTLAMLRAGTDRSYGDGFSSSGSVLRSYPRLRTVLMDLLRQIGTPEAKRGLLAWMDAAAGLVDMRDLLLLYSTSSDETMVDGISKRIPDVLAQIRRVGFERAQQEASMIEHYLSYWIRKRQLVTVADGIAALIAAEKAPSYRASDLFKLLIDLSPEKSVQAIAEIKRSGGTVERLLTDFHGTSPDKLVSFVDRLLSNVSLSSSERRNLVMMLRLGVDTKNPDSVARTQVLLGVFRRQLAIEEDESLKKQIQREVDRLTKSLAGS